MQLYQKFVCLLISGSLVSGSLSGFAARKTDPESASPGKAKAVTEEKKTTAPVIIPFGPNSAQQPHVCPPLVWGCEKEWKLQLGGDIQWRNEYRRNFDLRSRESDDDHLQFLRTRVDLDLMYKDLFRVFFQELDGNVYGEKTDPMQTDHWDVHQAFVDIRECEGSPWVLRLGRQEMAPAGEGRIFGQPPALEWYWVNLIKAFDGVSLNFKDPMAEIHAFLWQEVINQTVHEDTIITGHGSDQTHSWMWGAYSTFQCLKPHEFDLYFFGQNDLNDERIFPKAVKSEEGNFGTSDRYTVGTRWRGPIKKWEGCGTLGYGLESAYQFGHIAEDEINAYMVHADVNYIWEHPWKPKLTVLGNFASGDRKFGDEENNTFIPLFGASHYPYGVMDFVKLQNLRELGVVASVDPTEKLKVLLEYHHFLMASATDAWYTALGTSLGRDKTGHSGKDLGQEVDLTFQYRPTKHLSLEWGGGHFFSGEFAKNIGRGDSADYIFFQTIFKF